jgi:hypothetical protein
MSLGLAFHRWISEQKEKRTEQAGCGANQKSVAHHLGICSGPETVI